MSKDSLQSNSKILIQTGSLGVGSNSTATNKFLNVQSGENISDTSELDDLSSWSIVQDSADFFSPFLLKKSKTHSNKENILVDTGREGVKRPFSLEQVDGIFALLLFCFVFFSAIYRSGASLLRESNILSVFKTKSRSNLSRETTTSEFWSGFFLLFQSIFILSIIIYDFFLESSEYTLYQSSQNTFLTIIVYIFIIYIFIAIKDIFYRIIGYLFDNKEAMKLWRRDYIIIINMFGIISFIPALYLIYSDHYHLYALIFVFIVFILTRLIIFYRTITFFLEQNVNILFLIIYLCSVEILPYILLYRVLKFIYELDIISIL